MTDAERIAAYLNREPLQSDRFYDWTATEVVGAIAEDEASQAARLMAMLSDVRREEREACAAIVDEESRASVAASELLASSRLARIAYSIKARGTK